MFCGCPVAFGGEPNTRVCPVCLGLPGALPVPNQYGDRADGARGPGHRLRDRAVSSLFHRKQYFYPDMPKDYQISQYDLPFCADGQVERRGRRGLCRAAPRPRRPRPTSRSRKTATAPRIGITRIHLEEDTGKMVHVGGSEGRLAGATKSLVDFNRAGTPLIELVSEPDIRTPEEARRFAQKLRLVWLSLGISDCNMEEGSMRVDANVSLRRRGETELGTKAEVKNMNSFKALHDALGLRDRAPGRGARARWPHRARDAALGRGREAHELAAQQGRGARLPLLPRARHGALRVLRRVHRRHPRAAARAARRR